MGADTDRRCAGAIVLLGGEQKATSSYDCQQAAVIVPGSLFGDSAACAALLLGRACSAASMKVCVE
jgi:hypothetical protein